MQRLFRGLVVCALLFLPSLAARARVFSLDDNMAAPLTTPLPVGLPGSPFGFGYGTGAEDPFGTLAGPPGLAPSPSLATPAGPFIDGDILEIGPAFAGLPELNTLAPFDAFFGTGIVSTVDALSNNSIPPTAPSYSTNLLFSIDRVSFGGGTSDSAIQAGLGQQPGDIYHTVATLPAPSGFVGLPFGAGYIGPLRAPTPARNALLFDESFFELTAGGPPGTLTPPGVPAPFPTPPPFAGAAASHDNIDAFELRFIDVTADGVEDFDYFYSMNPDQALSNQFASGGLPFDSADIWYTPAGAGGASVLYAPAVAMGLVPFPAFPQALPLFFTGNDIDAMVVWDRGADGIATPGADYALFSLAPGSADLAAFGTSADDIFFTDFSGTYGLFAPAVELGLTGFDNVDALELVLTGDANLDGMVDFLDLSTLAGGFGMPGAGWLTADFNADGIVDFLDLSAVAGNFMATTGAITSIPEPSSALLCGTLLLMAAGVRRRK